MTLSKRSLRVGRGAWFGIAAGASFDGVEDVNRDRFAKKLGFEEARGAPSQSGTWCSIGARCAVTIIQHKRVQSTHASQRYVQHYRKRSGNLRKLEVNPGPDEETGSRSRTDLHFTSLQGAIWGRTGFPL